MFRNAGMTPPPKKIIILEGVQGLGEKRGELFKKEETLFGGIGC